MSCATQFSPKTKIFWCSAFGTVARRGREQRRRANSTREKGVAEKAAEFLGKGVEIYVRQ
jgi:predicted peroxiredoxin